MSNFIGIRRVLISTFAVSIQSTLRDYTAYICVTWRLINSRSESYWCIVCEIGASSPRRVFIVAESTLGSSLLVSLNLSVDLLAAHLAFIEVCYAAPTEYIFSLLLILLIGYYQLLRLTNHIFCLLLFPLFLGSSRYFTRIVAFICTGLITDSLGRLAILVLR